MVTLDIEDTRIKIMTIKGKHVDSAISQDIEPGLVEDGVIMDTSRMGQLLKQLMSDNKISEKRVIVGMTGIHSIYRMVKLPKLPVRMQAEAANREMGRVMPVPLNEVYTSWQAVDVSGEETAFCLVGLPRNSVDAMLNTLREAGLESRMMDVKPLAVARIIDEKNALVINVQPDSFDIVLILDGVPELMRSIAFPSRSSTPEEKIGEIKEELDRTVSFYNSSHKTTPITSETSVFISGEHSQLLAEQLAFRIRPLPQFLSYFEGFQPEDYVANIGLALKQINIGDSQIQININTVPEFYLPKPREVFGFITWALIGIFVVIIIFAVMSTGQELNKTALLQEQLDIAKAQVQKRQGTTEEVEEYRKELTVAESARDVFQKPLDEFTTQREKVNNDLSKITSLLPGTINLSAIFYEEKLSEDKNRLEKKWDISGSAPDEPTVLNYSNDLRNTNRFDMVTVSTSVVDYNQVAFTISLINYAEK
jgi:type IV pilus assembly protein PilM